METAAEGRRQPAPDEGCSSRGSAAAPQSAMLSSPGAKPKPAYARRLPREHASRTCNTTVTVVPASTPKPAKARCMRAREMVRARCRSWRHFVNPFGLSSPGISPGGSRSSRYAGSWSATYRAAVTPLCPSHTTNSPQLPGLHAPVPANYAPLLPLSQPMTCQPKSPGFCVSTP